jgi:hypothetical protein
MIKFAITMEKRDMTNDEFIRELCQEIHPTIGQWARELMEEKGMIIEEIKEVMQKMIDICERD